MDAPRSVAVRVGERGPVRARARITATYAWPDHVDGSSQARVGEHLVEVETDLELRADETDRCGSRPASSTRAATTASACTSRSPSRRRTSHAECAFTVVTRGLTAEGRADEFGLPTAPARRFVSRRAA